MRPDNAPSPLPREPETGSPTPTLLAPAPETVAARLCIRPPAERPLATAGTSAGAGVSCSVLRLRARLPLLGGSVPGPLALALATDRMERTNCSLLAAAGVRKPGNAPLPAPASEVCEPDDASDAWDLYLLACPHSPMCSCSNAITPPCPLRLASSRGAHPHLSRANGLAPWASSTATASTWPSLAAI